MHEHATGNIWAYLHIPDNFSGLHIFLCRPSVHLSGLLSFLASRQRRTIVWQNAWKASICPRNISEKDARRNLGSPISLHSLVSTDVVPCPVRVQTENLRFSYVSDLLWVKLDAWDYLMIGIGNAFLSVFSDLLESFVKRCAGVKVSLEHIEKHRIPAPYCRAMGVSSTDWTLCSFPCRSCFGTCTPISLTLSLTTDRLCTQASTYFWAELSLGTCLFDKSKVSQIIFKAMGRIFKEKQNEWK